MSTNCVPPVDDIKSFIESTNALPIRTPKLSPSSPGGNNLSITCDIKLLPAVSESSSPIFFKNCAYIDSEPSPVSNPTSSKNLFDTNLYISANPDAIFSNNPPWRCISVS